MVNVVIDLHLLEHLLDIGVVHAHLILLSLPQLFLDDCLMLVLVIGTLVPLMHLLLLDLLLLLGVPSALSLLLRVLTLLRLQIDLLEPVINRVVPNDLPYYLPYILLVGQFLKESSYAVELRISHIIVPTDARNGVFRLEHEGNRRVVHNNDVSHLPAEPRQVLHEGIVVVCAVLSE